MTAEEKRSSPSSGTSGFYAYFSVLFTFAIGCAAAIWEFYAYFPQYYLVASFALTAIAGVVAYIVLSKTVKI